MAEKLSSVSMTRVVLALGSWPGDIKCNKAKDEGADRRYKEGKHLQRGHSLILLRNVLPIKCSANETRIQTALTNDRNGVGPIGPFRLDINGANPPTAKTPTLNPFINAASNLIRSL